MSDFTWHGVYYSDLQSPFALLVVPVAAVRTYLSGLSAEWLAREHAA